MSTTVAITERVRVKHSGAATLLTRYLKARLVPMIHGSPGIGKSDIVKQIAKQFNLLVIDMRLSQCDPTDLLGFPNIVGGRAGYVPMETFPLEGDQVLAGYDGWLLFLDELNSAPMAVQAAAYKLILDRMVSQRNLHPRCLIAAAGNLESDGAIVMPMSTALQSRMVHIELELDHNEWCEGWAYQHGIDCRVTDYIKHKPASLYTFKPDHSDHTYACPRTWEFANRLLPGLDLTGSEALPLLSGSLSEGVAREFIGYCKVYKDLPKLSLIKTNPKDVQVPEEPSVLFALSGAIARDADDKSIVPYIEYVNRMPKEFQIVTLRETVRRNVPLRKSKEVVKWVADTGLELY